MSTSNVENFSPQTIRQVAKELSGLVADPPEGIKVFPNENDITEIHATIEGPLGTPYAGGIFKMKLVLGKNFPNEPPKGFFLTKIFHPNVAKNGEICVNTLKKDWKAEVGIKHVLLPRHIPIILLDHENLGVDTTFGIVGGLTTKLYSKRGFATIKCLLIVPNPESALNEEAGKLLLEQYDDYSMRAKMYTEIHAKPPPRARDSSSEKCSDGPLAKKRAGDKKVIDKKKKEKKKTLKRL